MKIAENFSLRMCPELKEVYSDGKAPIYVKVTVTGSKAKEFSTGIKVIPELWDESSWWVRGKTPDLLAINNRLTQIRAKLEKHYFF
ncbi:Arm DNA-binding domain-containing protein [Puia sp. P3]|uniref:Arm DNA-binding domain-containing protein n=1 Tax=Puia sp. P3 TaxID=3423952 RepID=UPI003D66C6B8